MKVYMDRHSESGGRIGRKIVDAKLVKRNGTSVIVQLPNGDRVKRKKRDIVKEQA